jgi:hypothetical protein
MLSQQGASQQIVEVDDFSGGMTDNILGSEKNKYEKADNFYLQKVNGKARILTRPAMRAYTSARIPTSTAINHTFDIEKKTFNIADRRIYENTTTAFTEVTGPTNKAFNLGDANSKYTVSTWQKHAIIANDAFTKVIRLYKNGASWTLNNLGLPSLSGTATLTAAGGSTHTYGYAFHFYTEYVNQGVTFAEQGAITFQSLSTNNDISGGHTVTITPPAGWTITNGATDNYLLANLKVKIWRTQKGGTIYYFLAEKAYNFASHVDSTTDAVLSASSNDVLYTNGADDVPIHEQPPQAKMSHIVNDILCLAHVLEDGEYLPNKLRISNRFQPWSCPSEFYEEFDEEIIGVNSFNISPIVFCKNKIYRIEGYFLPDGSGGMTKKLISSTAGCLSTRSIIRTDLGLFWAGNDGFYFTDGYQVQRISNDLLVSYLRITETTAQKSGITGTYYPRLQAVAWAIKANSTSDDNDTIYLTYLQAGISDSMPFSTWSGGEIPSGFKPTSLHHIDGSLYMGSYDGYLFHFDHDLFSDHRVEVGISVSSWVNKAIIYEYRSSAFDFGSSSIKKWVTKLCMSFENSGSISLQPYSINDNSGDERELKLIDQRGDVAWGDYTIEWGDPTVAWNYTPIISVKRMFPKNGLRCFYKQVIFKNAYAEYETSSFLGTATFNGAANTAILDVGANQWPSDIIDYFVSVSSDNYVQQYKILTRTTTTLTLQDSDNVLPTGSFAWKIQGYRRDEIVRIISYTLDYALTSQSGEVFRANNT